MPRQPDLERLLISVGKRVFVEYFSLFANSRLSNQQVADRLPNEYTDKSRLSRTSHARRIIREGLAPEALRIIAESERVDPAAVRAARQLLVTIE